MIDEVIAPMIHAQQIAYAQSDGKSQVPSIELAIEELDKWLSGADLDNLTPEQREYRRAMGVG